MMRLKSKLLSLNANKTSKVKVYSPRNCEELRIPFKADKMAKVVGKLASIAPPQDVTVDTTSAPLLTGVLVQNDFKLSLMAPEDLREYAGLNTTTIMCKQRLTLSAAGIDLIRWGLEGTFGAIEELPEMRRHNSDKNSDSSSQSTLKNGNGNGNGMEANDDDEEEYKPDGAEDDEPEAADEEVAGLAGAYLVMGCVTVRCRNNGEVELEWEGNMLNDSIADSVMGVLFSVESSPAAVKRSSSTTNHHHHNHHHSVTAADGAKNPHAKASPEERLERLFWFLEAQFGADNVSAKDTPRLPQTPPPSQTAMNTDGKEEDEESKGKKEEEAENEGEEEEENLEARQRKEIERLHKLGIPVPGVSIKVDKMVATVWLEDLEVECNNKVFADRIRAVVERAVEVTAPLWA